jgi:hypothetical protein
MEGLAITRKQNEIINKMSIQQPAFTRALVGSDETQKVTSEPASAPLQCCPSIHALQPAVLAMQAFQYTTIQSELTSGQVR